MVGESHEKPTTLVPKVKEGVIVYGHLVVGSRGLQSASQEAIFTFQGLLSLFSLIVNIVLGK